MDQVEVGTYMYKEYINKFTLAGLEKQEELVERKRKNKIPKHNTFCV